MSIIDGKKVASHIKDKLAAEVKILKTKTGKTPGLAVVLVGDDPAQILDFNRLSIFFLKIRVKINY